jgi:hypothetical protein
MLQKSCILKMRFIEEIFTVTMRLRACADHFGKAVFIILIKQKYCLMPRSDEMDR